MKILSKLEKEPLTLKKCFFAWISGQNDSQDETSDDDTMLENGPFKTVFA